MIRVVVREWTQHSGWQWHDNGDYLLHILSADHVMLARPDHTEAGAHYLKTMQRDEVRLKLRTPIPLFDAPHMGRHDAAKNAARAASTPTEELNNVASSAVDPTCYGG